MVGDALAGSRGRVGRCTSVTATRMTDAYGARTHKGCSPQVGRVGRVGSFAQTCRLTQYVDIRKGRHPTEGAISQYADWQGTPVGVTSA